LYSSSNSTLHSSTFCPHLLNPYHHQRRERIQKDRRKREKKGREGERGGISLKSFCKIHFRIMDSYIERGRVYEGKEEERKERKKENQPVPLLACQAIDW